MKRLTLTLSLGAVLAAPGCTDLDAPAAPGDVLSLTVSPRSLPADGFTSAQVVAEIDPRTNERFRDIAFSTTLGSFPAGTSTGARTIVASADASGRAVVVLRSAAQAGTATVTAEIRDGDKVKASQSVEVPFEGVAASTVVTIDVSAASAPADGASITNVVARVASALPSEQRTVSFTTTAGTLGGGSSTTAQVRAGSDDLATVGLTSPRTTGLATVTASVNDLTARRTVEFTTALPDDVTLVVSGSFRLPASFATKAVLRAQLLRDIGTVSKGTEVAFTATNDSSGNTFGYWSGETRSDASGLVNAEFTPGTTTERGEATLRVSVPGTGVYATVRVEVVPSVSLETPRLCRGGRNSLTVPGMSNALPAVSPPKASRQGVPMDDHENLCHSVWGASITWCSSRSTARRRCTGRSGGGWERCFGPWPSRRSRRCWKATSCPTTCTC